MKEYYKIGEISKLYNIGADSLRYYEEAGILKPRRDENGYRMYSINDIRTLNILRELRSIGFSLNEIKAHLADFDLQKTVELFQNAVCAIDQKTAELSHLKKQLLERIEEIGRQTGADIEFGKPLIRFIPQRRTLRLSEQVTRDDDVDFILKKLQAEYEDQLYIIGYSDVGATIPLDYLEAGGYGLFDSAFYIVEENEEYDSVIPAGNYLYMNIKGSYARVAPAWQKLLAYARQNKLRPEGHAIEIYVIDNHDTGKEEEYVTQLQIRLAEAAEAGKAEAAEAEA